MRSSHLALAALLGAIAPAAMAAQRCDHAHPLHVLFIGNSFTYVQNMPRMVQVIADTLPGPCIETAMIAVGGATLRDHWRADSVRARIASGHWTHVVLNDQSSFGEVFLLNGTPRIGGTGQELDDFGGRFIDAIRRAGVTPVLLAHWEDAGAPPRDQQAIDRIFARVAEHTGARVAPVGRAVTTMARTMALTPYYSDAHHLSAAGAYLEALTLYATLTGRSPIGAPRTIQGPAVEFQTGTVTDSIVTLIDLPAGHADSLQRLAERVARERFHPAEPAPLTAELPESAPADTSLSRDALLGRWQGASVALPTPSGDSLRFELAVGPDSLRLTAGLTFTGTAETVVRQGIVTVSGTVATASGRGTGKTALVVELRGAVSDGVMRGVLTIRQPDGPDAARFTALGAFIAEHVTP